MRKRRWKLVALDMNVDMTTEAGEAVAPNLHAVLQPGSLLEPDAITISSGRKPLGSFR